MDVKGLLIFIRMSYCSAFRATGLSGEASTSVLLPFVLPSSSHLYGSTPRIWIAIRLSQYFWENVQSRSAHRNSSSNLAKRHFQERGVGVRINWGPTRQAFAYARNLYTPVFREGSWTKGWEMGCIRLCRSRCIRKQGLKSVLFKSPLIRSCWAFGSCVRRR